MNRNIATFEHKIHIYHPNDQTESGVWGKVLTRCQSGKWSTLGGRGRLDPCAPRNHAVKARKKVSTDLWSFFCFKKNLFLLILINLYQLSPSLLPSFASIYCPCLLLPGLIAPFTPRSHPPPLAAFELLSVVAAVSSLCKGLRAGQPLMVTQP